MGQQIEKQAMSIVTQICTVRFVLGQNLVIPPYQRPYTWTQKNVMQLLSDIRTNMVAGKREYRIGTVICHKYNNTEKKDQYDIVDGQQRITTILMVLRELEVEVTRPNIKCKRNSVGRILENCIFTKGWIKDNLPCDKETFAKYPKLKKIFNVVFQRIMCIAFHSAQTDITYAFQLTPLRYLQQFTFMPDHGAFAIELALLPEIYGVPYIEIPSAVGRRTEGRSHTDFKYYFGYLKTGIKIYKNKRR